MTHHHTNITSRFNSITVTRACDDDDDDDDDVDDHNINNCIQLISMYRSRL
jgi:hypothetical protein